MKGLIIILAVLLLSPLPLLAQIHISEVLPNTDDDANLEYIDILNTGCESIDISGYQIADKEKKFNFAAGSTLASHASYRLSRTISKIVLNNSNEELTLSDPASVVIHNFTYATSTKGVAITVPGITLDPCTDDNQSGDDDGSGDSGNQDSNDSTDDSSDGGAGEEDQQEDQNDAPQTDTGSPTGSGSESDPASDPDPSSESDPEVADQNNSDEDNSDEDNPSDSGLGATGSTNILGRSGSLSPGILLYSDSDNDNRIDMLEILYDVTLTGSIDVSKILVYSNTGGLYDNRINTESGYILDAEIEDNILRLYIEPSHYEKEVLLHNATTQSEIRLKSSGGFGVMTFTGVIVNDFLLTSSFDAYREVYSKEEYELLKASQQQGTHQSQSGVVQVLFPEVTPTIQNYTNTTLSENTFICRETPCRLNLNFDSIFNSSFPSSLYSCRIIYNGVIEEKCNPSQWSPTGPGGLEVSIIHKATGKYKSQYYPIEWNIIPNQVVQSSILIDRSAPVPRIHINGDLSKKQIQKTDKQIVCYTSTCSINFDGSQTYDPDGSSMSYSWTLSGLLFSQKKNPTVIDLGVGEHRIELTVTDSSGKISSDYYTINVVGELMVPDDEVGMIASAIRPNKPQKKKKHTLSFFEPPILVVERSSDGFKSYGNGYRCVTTSASCSINFALTGSINSIEYRLQYSHEPLPLWSSNPRSKSFQPGNYTLTISAHYDREGESIWQQTIPIEVIRVQKQKISKSSKASKAQENTRSEGTSSKIEIIPTAYADNTSSDSSESKVTYSLLFVSIIMNVFFLRRRISNTV